MQVVLDELDRANKRIKELEKHLKDRDRIINKLQENPKNENPVNLA